MSKHTPGPWKAETSRQCFQIIAENKKGRTHIATIGTSTVGQEANARLIAAAPELLEALKAMRTAFRYDSGDEDQKEAWDKCNAAIAKAESR